MSEWERMKSLLAVARELDNQMMKLGFRVNVETNLFLNLENEAHEQTDLRFNPFTINLQSGEATSVEVLKHVRQTDKEIPVLLNDVRIELEHVNMNIKELFKRDEEGKEEEDLE